MSAVNYNDRRFKMIATSTGDEAAVSGTIFHYWQRDNVVWGTYEGGSVDMGTLVGTVQPGGNLEVRFQHRYTDGRLVSGKGHSTLTILPDGRYRLDETYTFFDDGYTGKSAVEEIKTG